MNDESANGMERSRNDAVSSSDYTASNDLMTVNNKLEWM